MRFCFLVLVVVRKFLLLMYQYASVKQFSSNFLLFRKDSRIEEELLGRGNIEGGSYLQLNSL